MAFGQASGPPAGARDVARLAELFEQAGDTSFKEARHPFGLTQRQAGGKFTRDEVEELTARLEAELDPGPGGAGPAAPAAPPTAASTSGARRSAKRAPAKVEVAALAAEVLVAELELRGWTCIPPL